MRVDEVPDISGRGFPVHGQVTLGEQLGQAYVAVNWEASVDDLASLIQPHPTMTEVLGEAMISLTGRPLHG